MKIARSLVLAVVGTLLLAAASANAASMSPVTKALPNVPCSVTAKLAVSSGVINYGGGLSCAQGVGQKTLDVVPQVYRVVNGHKLWYSISLIGLYQGPTAVNPLRLSSQTRAVAGHIYRLLVYGRVTLSNGQLGIDHRLLGLLRRTAVNEPGHPQHPTGRTLPGATRQDRRGAWRPLLAGSAGARVRRCQQHLHPQLQRLLRLRDGSQCHADAGVDRRAGLRVA